MYSVVLPIDEGIEANAIAKPSYQIYQHYQNGSVSNNLTHGERGGRGMLGGGGGWGDKETVYVWQRRRTVLCTPQSYNRST